MGSPVGVYVSPRGVGELWEGTRPKFQFTEKVLCDPGGKVTHGGRLGLACRQTGAARAEALGQRRRGCQQAQHRE